MKRINLITGGIEMPTCIIAADCKDGTIMVADRRETNGYEIFEEDKIYALPKEEPLIITGFSGLTGIRDKFIPFVSRAIMDAMSKEKIVELEELIWPIEETIKLLKDRYSERLTGRKGAPIIHALVAGKERIRKGEPKIYILHEEGYAEERRETACTGSAGAHANFLLRLLNPKPKERSVKEMLGIAARIILFIEATQIDINVGGNPQGAIISQDEVEVLPDAEMNKYIGSITPEKISEAAKETFSKIVQQKEEIPSSI